MPTARSNTSERNFAAQESWKFRLSVKPCHHWTLPIPLSAPSTYPWPEPATTFSLSGPVVQKRMSLAICLYKVAFTPSYGINLGAMVLQDGSMLRGGDSGTAYVGTYATG